MTKTIIMVRMTVVVVVVMTTPNINSSKAAVILSI